MLLSVELVREVRKGVRSSRLLGEYQQQRE